AVKIDSVKVVHLTRSPLASLTGATPIITATKMAKKERTSNDRLRTNNHISTTIPHETTDHNFTRKARNQSLLLDALDGQ
ncbi:MAG: hypothetical protein WAS51_15055, partial [Ilumatobacteraceae bacterium]